MRQNAWNSEIAPKLLASQRPENGQAFMQSVNSLSYCQHWRQNIKLNDSLSPGQAGCFFCSYAC